MGLKINFFKNNNKNYKLEHNLFDPHSVDDLDRIDKSWKECEQKKFTSGDVRLSMGLYRTPEEAEEYKTKSLKRKLP